jgi:chaperonin GroEL
LNATKAAVEEGIVAGGGVALLRALSVIEKLEEKGDRQYGVNVIKKALGEPLRMIATNAGQDGSIVVRTVMEGKGAYGYNAAKDEYEDLMKEGVVDPMKVVRVALQNAASVAGLMITTNVLVAEKPKPKESSPGMPGGGMPGMGADMDMGGMY